VRAWRWLDRDALDDDAIATNGAALFFGHAAPDPGVLTGRERPFETGLLDGARSSDGAGRLDLSECRACCAYREKEFRVDVATRRFMSPIHGCGIHAPKPLPGVSRRLRWSVCEQVLVLWERAPLYDSAFKSGNTFLRTTTLEDVRQLRCANICTLRERARMRKHFHERT
jgi:hypothetical protein